MTSVAAPARSVPRLDPELLWASVGTTLLACGVAVLALFPALVSAAPACVFKGLTGLACPTCGATRALLALASGHPAQALAWNPLATLGLIGGCLYLPYAWAAVAGLAPRLRTGWLTPPVPWPLRAGFAATLLGNWLYLLAARR
jgi:uncharacterized protein DUF2752